MAKEQENEILGEIQKILCTTFTATELAESYLNNRPPNGATSDNRDEIKKELSEFEVITGNRDLLNEIVDAYFHFSAPILYEDGYFSNRQIHDMLLTAHELSSKINDSINACELMGSAPVMVNAKSALIARNNLEYLTREPFYLEGSQLTELQMLCLDVPEAINEVIQTMGQRPFIRKADNDDRPYLQACIKVLYTLMEKALPTPQGKDGVAGSETKALIAGILTAFYHEYLSLPSEDYLSDLVNQSI